MYRIAGQRTASLLWTRAFRGCEFACSSFPSLSSWGRSKGPAPAFAH